MVFDNVIGVLVSAAMLLYLLIALIQPEKF